MTKVINLRYSPYDVYIGRAGKGQSGYFGNPHTMGRVYCNHCGSFHDREGAIEAFKKDFLIRIKEDLEYRSRVIALRDKVLGCFCKQPAGPEIPCHGDVYKEWLDNYEQIKGNKKST